MRLARKERTSGPITDGGAAGTCRETVRITKINGLTDGNVRRIASVDVIHL